MTRSNYVQGYVVSVTLAETYQEWTLKPTKQSDGWDHFVVRYPFKIATHPTIGRYVVAIAKPSTAFTHEYRASGWTEFATRQLASNRGY